jgi:four helix bundle protein
MGRLKQDLIDRLDSFADRVLDLADALAEDDRPRRIIEQLVGAGTSVGANGCEADEALSRADFCKCLGVSLKELSETRFWLRLTARRKWVAPRRLTALQQESLELKRILGAIVHRTRTGSPKKRKS